MLPATIQRTNYSIYVMTPGDFSIMSNDLIRPTHNATSAAYFSTTFTGTFYRNQLIAIANGVRALVQEGKLTPYGNGLKKSFPISLDLLILSEDKDLVPELMLQIKEVAERKKIAIAKKEEKEREALILYNAQLEEAQKNGEWWKIEVWSKFFPKPNDLFGPKHLNIGGYGVLAHPAIGDMPINVNLLVVTGIRPDFTDFKGCFAELQPSDRAYLEPFTLINLATKKPDFEKTAEWHQKDPEFLNYLTQNLGTIYEHCWTNYGGYYVTEIAPRETEKLDLTLYPDNLPECCCKDLTRRLAEMGCPEVEVRYAAWAFVKTSYEKPKFSKGKWIGYYPEEIRKLWALRVGVYLEGERWNKNNIHFWVTYNPSISTEYPWRFVKSTQCQRQSAWSKEQFFYQIEPEATWAAEEWMVQSLSQLTEMYPAKYRPIFKGSEFNSGRPNFQLLLKGEFTKGKNLLDNFLQVKKTGGEIPALPAIEEMTKFEDEEAEVDNEEMYDEEANLDEEM